MERKWGNDEKPPGSGRGELDKCRAPDTPAWRIWFQWSKRVEKRHSALQGARNLHCSGLEGVARELRGWNGYQGLAADADYDAGDLRFRDGHRTGVADCALVIPGNPVADPVVHAVLGDGNEVAGRPDLDLVHRDIEPGSPHPVGDEDVRRGILCADPAVMLPVARAPQLVHRRGDGQLGRSARVGNGYPADDAADHGDD